MKTQEIGAFDAKTRFAELLRGVEAGMSYTITRKGRPIARLTSLEASARQEAASALTVIREARAHYGVKREDLDGWRREGRRGG